MAKVIYHMTVHEPEWDIAWGHFSDPIMLNKMTGDTLEYMDSRVVSDGTIIHGFRHRCHPETLYPTMCFIPATPGWREALDTINTLG